MAKERPGRTLVLCFDGTSNEFDETNTNVVHFFSLLHKRHNDKQLVYYQPGIGTYATPGSGAWGTIASESTKLLDKALASYIQDHILGGYEFLMQQWSEGDRVCLFGFSRGAYTARSLAGMLDRVGLLPCHNREQIPFAYKAYLGDSWQNGQDPAPEFKRVFSRKVPVDFIGVWDTVESVGVVPRSLRFAASQDSIKFFRHALSLDERRVKFRPNLWHYPSNDPSKDKEQGSAPVNSDATGPPTDVLEVWFAGNHCDVGGGNEKDASPEPNLANIPLRWMVQECAKANVGIIFDEEALDRRRIPRHLVLAPPDPKSGHDREATLVGSTPTPTKGQSLEELDNFDIKGQVHDQLDESKSWWLLEFVPRTKTEQDSEGNWKTKFEWNRGYGRDLLGDRSFNVHRSLLQRLKNDPKYKPNMTHGGKELKLPTQKEVGVLGNETYFTIPPVTPR